MMKKGHPFVDESECPLMYLNPCMKMDAYGWNLFRNNGLKYMKYLFLIIDYKKFSIYPMTYIVVSYGFHRR
jgi:hypothetical protein